MAQGFRFVCHKCDHAIVAWDDGNPYYLETVMTKIDLEKRQFAEVKHKKKYAYHPNHELLDAARADAFSHDAAPPRPQMHWRWTGQDSEAHGPRPPGQGSRCHRY